MSVSLGEHLRRAFWRIDHDPLDLEEWQQRMDALLHSDPLECLEFITDLLMAVAVKSKVGDPVENVDRILAGIREASIGHPQFETVYDLVKQRYKDLFSRYEEFGDEGAIRKAIHEIARKAPWPD